MLENLPLTMIELTDEAMTRLIAHRVRLARELTGLSQQRVAQLIDVSFQQVQKYEKGMNRICPAKLARLARATGRSIGWFYDDVAAGGSSAEAGIVSRLANDRDFAELAATWDALRPPARATAGQMMQLLAALHAELEQGRAA